MSELGWITGGLWCLGWANGMLAQGICLEAHPGTWGAMCRESRSGERSRGSPSSTYSSAQKLHLKSFFSNGNVVPKSPSCFCVQAAICMSQCVHDGQGHWGKIGCVMFLNSVVKMAGGITFWGHIIILSVPTVAIPWHRTENASL